jgi:hypothetical protein
MMKASTTGNICSPGTSIGTGSFATICTVKDNDDIVRKLFHNDIDVQYYMPNVIAIFNALSGENLLNHTSFATQPSYTTVTPPSKETYSYMLKRCDGALTDAFAVLDKDEDLQSNWEWVSTSVETAVRYIKDIYKTGIIHGDAKLENVLYKADDSIYVHDFDGSCLLNDPIDHKLHSFTVRYVHPLYFAFKELYYPIPPGYPRTPPRFKATVSLLWNVYLAKQTESLKSELQTNLITAQKALILYLYDVKGITDREIVTAFVHVAKAKTESLNIFRDELDIDRTIDELFYETNLQDNVIKWMPHFDEFSLRCSLFIRATIWKAFYENKNLDLTTTINQFCIGALEKLKGLVNNVEQPGLKGGKKSRKKKMTGGGPKKPAQSDTELKKFMNADHHRLNTCLMSIEKITYFKYSDNADATVTGFAESRSSTTNGFITAPPSASSTLSGMIDPQK